MLIKRCSNAFYIAMSQYKGPLKSNTSWYNINCCLNSPATDWGCIYKMFNYLFAPLVVGLITAWFTDWLKSKHRK